MSRLTIWSLAICTVFASTAFAESASEFPSRAVEIVVPYPAGGPNDVIARLLGDQMSRALGETVIVRNRPGAGGNVATAFVSRAKADGYTLLLPAMAFAVNPSLFKDVQYKMADFEPVSMVARGPLVLVTHPDLGFKTVQDLIDAAARRPGEIEFASGGIGTSLHLAAELFDSMAKIDMLHVPYKGTGELMPDLIAGRVGVLFSSPLTVRQQIDQGQLTALGVTSSTPASGWETVPPIAQTIPDHEMFAWYSLMAPAGVPSDIMDKLNAAVRTAQESPDFIEKMGGLGVEGFRTSRTEAARYIQDEAEKWADTIQKAGISPI